MGLPYRARKGRVRRRHLARGGPRDRQWRAQLGRAHDRRSTRHRLHPDGNRALRFLRRQPPWRQPVREQHRRARCEDRQTTVALSSDSPRSVGLRPGDLSEAADRQARWPRRRRRRAGEQARLRVRVRPRIRAAALADRRASRPAKRRAGRANLADAAVSDPASALRAAVVHRARRQPVSCRPRCRRKCASGCARR